MELGQGRGESQGGKRRAGHRASQRARPLPYDRKKFLQANFRFLAGDAGNLHLCEKDPDLALDWEDVVEVGSDGRDVSLQLLPCLFSSPHNASIHVRLHERRRHSPCLILRPMPADSSQCSAPAFFRFFRIFATLRLEGVFSPVLFLFDGNWEK